MFWYLIFVLKITVLDNLLYKLLEKLMIFGKYEIFENRQNWMETETLAQSSFPK